MFLLVTQRYRSAEDLEQFAFRSRSLQQLLIHRGKRDSTDRVNKDSFCMTAAAVDRRRLADLATEVDAHTRERLPLATPVLLWSDRTEVASCSRSPSQAFPTFAVR
jgi:hypothetical protein